MKRHTDFVNQYKANMQMLLDGLAPFDGGFLGIKALFNATPAKDEKAVELSKLIKDKWLPKEFNLFKDGKFPKKQMDFHPREPLDTTGMTPAYQKTASLLASTESFSFKANEAPTSGDLKETIEVKLTPEIKELARQLDYNPVKIFEYVHNNIDYAPYYGSVKGAQEALWQKAGNDFDQASLLIALLRASGIPSRYVYGVVQIPVDQVKN